MAPPPPPRRTAPLLPLLSLLLLFAVAAAHAAREAPPASWRGHAELREGQDKEVRRAYVLSASWQLFDLAAGRHVVDGKEETMAGFAAAEAEDDPCGGAAAAAEGGGAEQEECLVRRTLAAHTDYNYTQGAGGHN